MAVLRTNTGSILRWAPNKYYSAERTVYNPDNFRIYKCDTAHTSNASFAVDYAAGNWQELSIDTEPWIPGKQLYAGRTYYNNTINGEGLYVAVPSYVARATILEDIASGDLRPLTNYKISQWFSGYGYGVGYCITINGLIYRCITAHVAGATFVGDIANWTPIGATPTFKLDIPNNQSVPLNVPNLAFDFNLVKKVKINIISSRVASTPNFTAVNEYNLTCLYINAAWTLIQNNIIMDIGGWDEITWGITAGGQVTITTSNIAGTPDVVQSNMIYEVECKG